MTRRAVAALVASTLLLGACHRARPLPEQPVAGGTLRVSVRDLATLDPAKAAGPGARAAVAQLFDPLTSIDPRTQRAVGAAATSWKVSKDGLVWRFAIRKATYSDGTQVVAGDFKFAFDRIARRSTRSDAAFQLEQVRGFRELHDTARAASLAGVAAPDPHRLVITLARPYAELPYALAHPALAPLPARRYARTTKGIERAPVSSGPFRVGEVTLGSSATLVRNGRYAGARPWLEAIELRVAKTDEGWRAYRNGTVDVAEVPAAAIAAGEGPFGEGGFTPAWATLSFGPNLALAKYRKPEVRKALALAVDRNALATTVYGSTKVPASGILPAGVRGFRPEACSVCRLDRDRARTILRAAFGSKPPKIVIDHLSERSSRRVAGAVADGLTAVGVPTALRPHSAVAYRAFLAAGRHDFAQLGWLADVPTPDGFLAQQLRTGSANNETGFSDALFDARVDRARAEQREEPRLKLYEDAERRALELMPLIPIVFFRNRTAVAARVRGFSLDGAGLFDGATVWLAAR